MIWTANNDDIDVKETPRGGWGTNETNNNGGIIFILLQLLEKNIMISFPKTKWQTIAEIMR